MLRNFQALRLLGWLRLILFGLTSLSIALLVIIPLYFAYLLTRPSRSDVCCDTPNSFGISYEAVRLTTADHLSLAAWYIPPAESPRGGQPGVAVVLAHGSGGNRQSMLPYAILLARHGYGSLSLDLRAHGESDGQTYALGWDSGLDIAAALDHLQTRPEVDPQKLGGLGLSLGADVLLEAASQDPRLLAVVLEGAGARSFPDSMRTPNNRPYAPALWVLYQGVALFSGASPPSSAFSQAPQISPRAVYFIYAQYGSGGEELTPLYYQAASEPKELWYLSDGRHVGALAEQPDEYELRIISFFNQYLAQELE
jgi:pimeloyl-ACP methyl ester carboxylesterase